MNQGITKGIQRVLAKSTPRAMSGDEVYQEIAAMPFLQVTAGTVKTLLSQRCKTQHGQPALWRKAGWNSYAAL